MNPATCPLDCFATARNDNRPPARHCEEAKADAAIQNPPPGSPRSARDDSANPIVAVDPRYSRPTEVETLLGDLAKAKPTPSPPRGEGRGEGNNELVKKHGYKAMDYHE